MNHEKGIILLGAGYTTPNMGVWALASGTIGSIFYEFPSARVYILDYNKNPETYELQHLNGTTNVELINIRFSKRIFLQNNIVRMIFTALLLKVARSQKLKDKILKGNPGLKLIFKSDIIGSIAGGDSFSDIYGLSRLLYVSLPQVLVLLMKKPLILLPQTLGPFKSQIAGVIAKYILTHAKRVYARDKESLLAARDIIHKNKKKLKFCHDVGFALNPLIADERIPGWLKRDMYRKPLLGLNVSGLLYVGGYNQSNMFNLKLEYRQLIEHLIRLFIRKFSANILLVPHVFGKENNSESDLSACRKVYQSTDNNLHPYLHLIEDEYDHHEIKSIIGYCDFFLGSRMHACIAALSQSIPAIGLSYSRKFRGVFASIGMENLVFDLRKYDLLSILTLTEGAYQNRLQIKHKLERTIPDVKRNILSLWGDIDI